MDSGSVDLTDLDRALAGASPTLEPEEQRIAVATYEALASGVPADITDIATRAGSDPTTVDQRLGEWGAVFRDEKQNVIGFWGLALPEMPHRLRIGTASLHAWCAWDPLFLALLIGPMAVETADPVTGETVTYRLDKGGEVSELSHPDSVLSFLRPGGEWGDDVMETFCHHVLHFADDAAAAAWTAEHPGTFVLELDDAQELARRHVTRTFGDR